MQRQSNKPKPKDQVCKVAGKYNGGRFDFDDGGTYCGGWEEGKAHGHGVCTGPDGQGEYAGAWHYGYEVSGVYTWPGGSQYMGQWMKGVRHGLGLEKRGRWIYRGEWHDGSKGRYGVRQSTTSIAKYEGTWLQGVQDGYGSEIYADGGSYKGQWGNGYRQGYGVRTSAPFGQAASVQDKAPEIGPTPSLKGDQPSLLLRDKKVDSGKGGFVLRANSGEDAKIRPKSSDKSNLMNVFKGSKIKRQKSVGDLPKTRAGGSLRSNGSEASWISEGSAKSVYTVGDNPDGSNASFFPEDEKLDSSVVEIYMGEWKYDKREGFGFAERSDGLKYEGEWHKNKKYGYGVTYFQDGTKEEGKYKNNVLISSRRKYMLMVRSAKFRDRIETAVSQSQRAVRIASQKEDISISRTATARSKSEQADIAARHALEDCEMARAFAKSQAPDFQQPGLLDSTTALLQDHSKAKVQEKPPTPAPESLADDFLQEDQQMSVGEGPGYTSHSATGIRDKLDSSNRRSSISSSLADGSISQFAESNQIQSTSDRSRPTSKGPHSRQKDKSSTRSAIMNDRFDHYNRPPSRPPSRDRSTDRMASRGQTPVPSELINPRSRAPSAHRTPAQDWTPDSGMYETESATGGSRMGSRRSSKPSPLMKSDIKKLSGNGNIPGVPYHIPTNQQEAESMIRQRACGQEITPSITPMGSVKRTESLYINPVIRRQEQVKEVPQSVTIKRKQSIPDAKELSSSKLVMSREEASVLSSQQRETIRRNMDESQRYRENPLLYLTSPRVQDWFSKQRLLMLILFVNLSLAYLFFKLLS